MVAYRRILRFLPDPADEQRFAVGEAHLGGVAVGAVVEDMG